MCRTLVHWAVLLGLIPPLLSLVHSETELNLHQKLPGLCLLVVAIAVYIHEHVVYSLSFVVAGIILVLYFFTPRKNLITSTLSLSLCFFTARNQSAITLAD